jgi:hypothetical protein
MLVLAAHFLAAVLAWRFLPHGFGWMHPRFWSNEVLPFAVAALSAAGFVGLLKGRVDLAGFVMTGTATTYLATAAAWPFCFPISGRLPAAAAMVSGMFLLVIGGWSLRGLQPQRTTTFLGAIAGILLGCMLPLSQRGADPTTRPAEPHRDLADSTVVATAPPDIPLPSFAALAPRWGAAAPGSPAVFGSRATIR